MTDHQVSVLMLACGNGSLPIIKQLLKAGANVNHNSIVGETPLSIAEEKGHSTVVRLIKGRQSK